jgi:hypothetical protein
VVTYCRIGAEERKLLLAQRKLESIRVLDELLSRVKVKLRILSYYYSYPLRGLSANPFKDENNWWSCYTNFY